MDQEDITCDGYKVLYRLLEQVNPNLNNEADIIMEPKYNSSDDVFSFCKKYGHYLGYQRGMGNNISDQLAYNYVTQIIAHATADYSDGISECQKLYRDYMQSLERWENSGQSVNKPFFPRHLKLDELPLTISKYSKSFASSAKINRLQDIPLDWNDNDAVMNRLERRKQFDAFCKGCGRYGHDVNKNGQCDIVAQVSNSIKWLKNAKPSDLQNVVKTHKDFQYKRKSASKQPNNTKGAKIKAANALDFLTQYDLDDAICSDSDSHHDSDTFSQQESA